MSPTVTLGKPFALATACIVVALQSGCTSALTTAYLRDGLWTAADHAASAPDDAETAADAVTDAPGEPAADTPAPAEADRERREAALEEAMARLSHLGDLDPAVEAALVATLQRTQPEDWPVVVDEFAGSLATSGVAATTPEAVATESVADASQSATSRDTEPAPAADAIEPEASAAVDEVPPTAQAESPAPAPTADPAPVPPADPVVPEVVAEPPLAVRTACFASAVRAWGDIDRFAADRFHPGQEVIVYVELDNLSAGSTPAGHTTCIDAVLRLVDAAGVTLHTWSFDPLAETSPSRRHDYFARYVVQVPESIPGGQCRVEVEVIDTRSGSTARTTLPLEIAAAD